MIMGILYAATGEAVLFEALYMMQTELQSVPVGLLISLTIFLVVRAVDELWIRRKEAKGTVRVHR